MFRINQAIRLLPLRNGIVENQDQIVDQVSGDGIGSSQFQLRGISRLEKLLREAFYSFTVWHAQVCIGFGQLYLGVRTADLNSCPIYTRC